MVAQEMFFSLGYEKVSIQKIIDRVEIAKGTFYHHFKSKEDLLDQLTDSIVEKQVSTIFQYVDESDDDAITKFNKFIGMQSTWKSQRFELLFAILEAYYTKENLMLRDQLKLKNTKYYLPIMNKIIKQGIEEQVFKNDFPDLVGEMIFIFTNNASDEMAQIFLNFRTYDDPASELKTRYKLIINSIERILGCQEGLLTFSDQRTIDNFIEFLEERND